MRIVLVVNGGLAPIPALAAGMTIDTEALSLSARVAIEELVAKLRFFDLPPRLGIRPEGAGDVRTYSITIEDRGAVHRVDVHDPVDDPALVQLISHLRDACLNRPRTQSAQKPRH